MEDAKIIELFFQRNEQAIKETDTAYGRKLYALSNNILNNREDAEESVSDTYMYLVPLPARCSTVSSSCLYCCVWGALCVFWQFVEFSLLWSFLAVDGVERVASV